MFSITEEIECYIACITDSSLLPLMGMNIFLALLLFTVYLKAKSSVFRIFSFIAAQLSMVFAIGMVASAMQCSQMLTIEIYTAYVLASSAIILLLPCVYYKALIKRYRARPITEVMDWPQHFVNILSKKAEVYYYDSAVPRAFASGKAVFLSMGMLELMDESELKAILAHEVWHIRHNNKTPILRQLSIMTFTRNRSEDELELLADIFAGEVVSKDAVESARAKLN
ncbi:M48 family metalloprotease [Methanosarcina sp. KYL-1]|uniref:M48 family metalloprotease n=1 Tax=Methanosarcina sp. KYL-1 TaxID=2602068 RepID=UPI002100BC50|nr:M48 family metalloprotease [Methanosarcina sp. KYL-1]MCQ1535741.1 M48 family metalloprotease [Methanosarcina sp. KYL-1]